MATWSGWQRQLLGAAGLPTGSENVRFMTDWANHANRPGCARNPVDISHHATGSTNCGSLPSSKTAQAFTSHARAAGAFAAQFTPSDYSHLHAALASSSPYDTSHTAGVALDLEKWGSTKFQQAYISETGTGSGVGGGGGDNYAPHAMKAWGEIQKQVNKTMPHTLRRMSGFHHATQTQLRRKHRVGR